jgi:DNA-binding winged helix-turn-helix (wHTH) protein
MVALGPFRERLGSCASDLLLALIEGSRAVVGNDELSSRVWQGQVRHDRRREPAVGHKTAALHKCF